ncbi:hypothetical protein [uncultured Hyphomicrobium sp.]|jgi:hypothetical protein|uniref:hypothetical protein n=1 Tax=uncultured Hyphomicrobium sp. TaxID=194373 RepID=UPI0025E5C555|nr:hypothetical protein [uncultured Hyphomicrobium sp.]
METVRLVIEAPIRRGKICLARGTKILRGFDIARHAERCGSDDPDDPEFDPLWDLFPSYMSDFDALPDHITIDGDLVLEGSDFKKLPKGLIVTGTCYLQRTDICELPPDLQVHGELLIDRGSIEVVPPSIKVGKLTVG